MLYTKHGQKRMSERGLTKHNKSTEKYLSRVLRWGIKRGDAIGDLKKLMDAKAYRYTGGDCKKAAHPHFYRGRLFIFNNYKLITVYPIDDKITNNLENNIKPEAYKVYMQRLSSLKRK